MSARINTNTTAFEAARNLTANSNKQAQNIQRLSSGLRINSAADDAAGLVISESLLSQSAGLTQATNNTNDAINVVKTAEGALNEVQSLLINVRQTIIQSANVGSNNSTALQADKDSIAAAIASINRISSTTQFNGKSLLDGSAGAGSAAITSGTATTTATNSQVATLGVISNANRYGTAPLSNATVAFNAAKSAAYTVTGDGSNALTSASTFSGSLKVNGTTINLGSTPQSLDQLNAALENTGSTFQATVSSGALKLTDSGTGVSAGASTFDVSSLSYASAATPLNSVKIATGTLAEGNNASVTVTKTDAAGVKTAYTSDQVTTTSDGTSTFGFTTGTLKGLQLSSNANTTSLPVVTGTGTATSAGSYGLAKVSDAKSYGTTAITGSAVTTVAATASTITSTSTSTTGDVYGGSLTVNGQAVTLTGNANSLATLNSAIQATTGNSGIVATVAGSKLVLTDATGAALTATLTSLHDFTGGTDNGAVAAPSASTNGVLAGYTGGNVSYTAATAATLTSSTNTGAVTGDTFGGSLKVNGTTISLTGTSNNLAAVNSAIQATAGNANVTATIASNKLVLTDSKGAQVSANVTGLSDTTTSSNFAQAATASTNGVAASVTVNGQKSTSSAASGANTVFSFAGGALDGLAVSATTSALAAGTLGNFAATADTPPANVGSISTTADKVTTGTALQFQIGANAGQTIDVSIGSQKADSIGSFTNAASGKSFNLSDLLAGGGLNVTDTTGVSQQDALKVVDQAIADISKTREQLGSIQSNVLQSNLNSLGVAQQNTDASASTIRDTNLSSEIVDYTKNQILVQAGTSALSYANQAPQAILKLLQ
jgi:flagellin